MMGHIYSQAIETLVYAGSGDWDIEIALRDAESWVRSLKMAETAAKSCTRLLPATVVTKLWWKHTRGFTALCKLSYWDRAWIKQEILLANNLVFVYWNTHCHWQRIVLIMTGAGSRLMAESGGVAITLSADPTERSLCEHLATFNHLKCTDPRDRMFSLLGISKNGADFPVDYSMSLSRLFVRPLMISNMKKWLVCRHTDKTASDIDMAPLTVSPDMPKLRGTCEILSLCLFEVEFRSLDLAEVPQAVEFLGLATLRTTVHLQGRIFQLSCKQQIQ